MLSIGYKFKSTVYRHCMYQDRLLPNQIAKKWWQILYKLTNIIALIQSSNTCSMSPLHLKSDIARKPRLKARKAFNN